MKFEYKSPGDWEFHATSSSFPQDLPELPCWCLSRHYGCDGDDKNATRYRLIPHGDEFRDFTVEFSAVVRRTDAETFNRLEKLSESDQVTELAAEILKLCRLPLDLEQFHRDLVELYRHGFRHGEDSKIGDIKHVLKIR